MALSIFKKTPPLTTIGPARAALTDHIATRRSVLDRIATLDRRIGDGHADIARLDGLRSEITARRNAIDSQEADAFYSGDDPPDLSQDRKALDGLTSQLPALEEKARKAQSISKKLDADLALLIAERERLTGLTPRLLWEACREHLATLAEEFKAAELAFRAVHRKAFVAAKAADKISMSQRFGLYTDSALFAELHITRPAYPGFVEGYATPEAALNAHVADVALADREADELVNAMLSGEM